MAVDVLLVSLGSTHGWRVADAALAASMRRAGARVEVVAAEAPRPVRTFALTDLGWALGARRAAVAGIRAHAPRAVVYSTTTAALFAPRPGAIRFDATAQFNRPGRHGVWQRPLERRRLAAASLLVPMSDLALDDVPAAERPPAVVVPVPVEPSGAPLPLEARDIDALVYASDPWKKGLDLVLAAWQRVRRAGEELVVVSERAEDAEGIRVERSVRGDAYRALVRRARAYVVAPRREDFGIAQLEALADGCRLVTTLPPGPYAAGRLAQRLDPRLAGDDLDRAIRTALDDPLPDYAVRAAELLAPFRPEAVDATVSGDLLPRLLAHRAT